MPSLRTARPLVDLWTRPTRSDRASQLVLGTPVTIVDRAQDWLYIEGPDRYRGWAEERLLTNDAPAPTGVVTQPFADVRQTPSHRSTLVARLPMLARLAAAAPENGFRAVSLPGGAEGFVAADALSALPPAQHDRCAATAVGWAREFLGTPYLWGGSSPFGMDCSGYVQLLYQLAGVTLRRDADIQRTDPRFVPVDFDTLLPGDLVFFGAPDKITHVGMQLAPGEFVHAAGGVGVVVSPWDDARYAPGFVDARRLDPSRADCPVERFEAENR